MSANETILAVPANETHLLSSLGPTGNMICGLYTADVILAARAAICVTNI